MLVLVMAGVLSNAQKYDPLGPMYAPDITLFGGPHLQISAHEYAEFGVIGGFNFKDIVLVGPYYQHSVRNNNFYGLYTQVNTNPKHYFVTVGFAAKVGYVNTDYLTFEPYMTVQHNTSDDRFKFTHAIGFTSGFFPSYSFGFWFGNFEQKYWKKPLKTRYTISRHHRLSKRFKRRQQ